MIALYQLKMLSGALPFFHLKLIITLYLRLLNQICILPIVMANFKNVLRDFTPPIAWELSKSIVGLVKKGITTQIPDGDRLIETKSQSVRGVFVHIHKCAGTSLVEAFADNPHVISCLARPGVFPGRTGRAHIPDQVFDQCIKFTFVRNPYTRIVSAYKMFHASYIWKDCFPTFDHFVEFIQWTNIHSHKVEKEISISKFMNSMEDIIHHCSSYHNPKYMLDQMDYIGRVETIGDDLKKLAEILKIEPIKVKHLNKHKNDYDYRQYYSTSSKDLISKLYQKDIERFEYSF